MFSETNEKEANLWNYNVVWCTGGTRSFFPVSFHCERSGCEIMDTFFEASQPRSHFRMSRKAAQLNYFVPFQVSWGLEVSQLGQYKYPVLFRGLNRALPPTLFPFLYPWLKSSGKCNKSCHSGHFLISLHALVLVFVTTSIAPNWP